MARPGGRRGWFGVFIPHPLLRKEWGTPAVLDSVTEYEVDAYVVGLPLHIDGSEGPQAKLTRRIGKQLARKSGIEVHFTDERLSSATADELLAPADLTRKKHKARRDAVAAQVILQTYLD